MKIKSHGDVNQGLFVLVPPSTSKEEGLPQKSMRKDQRGLHYLEVPGCVIQKTVLGIVLRVALLFFGCFNNLLVYCRVLYAVSVTLSNKIFFSRMFIFFVYLLILDNVWKNIFAAMMQYDGQKSDCKRR